MNVLAWVVCSSILVVLIFLLLKGHARCKSNARLDGKTVVITGCNTGIGKITAMDMYKRGARVVMLCRNVAKALQAKKDIETESQDIPGIGEIVVSELDLCSLASVRTCARNILDTEPRIDILINNAGVMTCPEGRTEDGFEVHFGSNHLGHFLLTLLLLPKIRKSSEARIVTVASLAHIFLWRPMLEDLNWRKTRYNRISAYGLSKTANIVFSRELDRKLKEHNINNVTTYSLHPGAIQTDLGRHLSGVLPGLTWLWYNCGNLVLKTPEQGAQTTIYCAVDAKCARESGLYYSECAASKAWLYASSDQYARSMWDKSIEMLQLQNYNPFVDTSGVYE